MNNRIFLLLVIIACSLGKLFSFTAPDGFTEATSTSEILKARASSTLQRHQSLIGIYYPTDILKSTPEGANPPYCTFFGLKKFSFGTETEAKNYFDMIKKNARREMSENFDPNNRNVKLILNDAKEKGDRVTGGNCPTLGGMTPLGFFEINDNVYGTVAVVKIVSGDVIYKYIPYNETVLSGNEQYDFTEMHTLNNDSDLDDAKRLMDSWRSQNFN